MARMAEADRALMAAAAAYREAVALDPQSVELADRGYRQAVLAGDKALALRAARALDAAGRLPRDGTVLLLIDALDRGAWNEARGLVDRLEGEENLAFLVPFMRSWLSIADGPYDPPVIPVEKPYAAFAVRYLEEQLLLQRLALGDSAGAVDAHAQAAERGLMLGPAERWAMAARFAALGQKDIARDLVAPELLPGEDADALLAQALRRYGEVRFTPQSGLGILLYRLALDLLGHGEDNATLSIARMASFAASDDEDIRLAVARAALSADYPEVTFAEASRFSEGAPGLPDAQSLRLRALLAQGQGEEAAARARTLSEGSADPRAWRLLGDILMRTDDFSGAASTYAQARTLSGDKNDPALLLQLGAALEQAGRWEEAKPLLEQVVSMAPDSALALNHLGYSLADRGEELPRAIELLERANRLRPNQPAFIDSLGWALHRAGKHAKALPLIQGAVAAEPGNAELNEHLGDILWAMGRRFEARHAWQAALMGLEDGTAAQRLRDRIEKKLGIAGDISSAP